MTGRFIVFEGLDGSGKTLQSIHTEKILLDKGIDVVRVIDPGGTEVGDILRNIVKTKNITNMTALMLFMASRYELYHNVIKPVIDAGKWVISDRFFYSTYVYQGVYQGLKNEFYFIKKMLFNNVKVDHVFYLDISPEVSSKRINSRQDGAIKDNYDDIDISKKQIMRNAYLDLYKTDSSFIYIPACSPEFVVTENIKQYLNLMVDGYKAEFIKDIRGMLYQI